MAIQRILWLYIVAFCSFSVLLLPASGNTDQLDVIALNDLYNLLNSPTMLIGWRSSGGDPCGEGWMGVSCLLTSVISIKIQNLGLNGSLGTQLSSLSSLKELDLSNNSIGGAIPSSLPQNITILNLAFNQLNQNIPFSMEPLKYLNYLNLSHNSLSGPIGNIFTDLTDLISLDISFNSFTGDLPSSFSSLINLHELFLQNNQLAGSVSFLANLPLTDLNVQNNYFSGALPAEFNNITNLSIEGNMFEPGSLHPRNTTSTYNESSHRDAETKSSAVTNYPSSGLGSTNQRTMGPGMIAFAVAAATLVTICIAAIVSFQYTRKLWYRKKETDNEDSSLQKLPITTSAVRNSVEQSSTGSLSLSIIKPIPSIRRNMASKLAIGNNFSGTAITAFMNSIRHSISDLKAYTGNFCEDNFLGEGSFGSVYRGHFPDGQAAAVKKLNMMELCLHEEDQFLEVIYTVSHLRHPNIASLLGYCMEHGQYCMIYEFAGHYTLEDSLHNPHVIGQRPLSLIDRLKIGLSIARALEYLHCACTPPVPHGSIKAANIMLDEEVVPRLCDCGVSAITPLMKIKVQPSELPVGCTGYTAPEHGKPGINKTSSDVYEFGVLLLELLTAKKPFDSSRVKEERSLVRWLAPYLRFTKSLSEFVDPAIKDSYNSHNLSQLAEVIILCIQPEPTFRPSVSDVADSLNCLLQRVGKSGQGKTNADARLDSPDMSFLTTVTRFESSPPMISACSEFDRGSHV